MPLGREGLGASQSFGLRRQARWQKVWLGGRGQIQRDGTKHTSGVEAGFRGMQAEKFGHAYGQSSIIKSLALAPTALATRKSA